MEDFIYNTLMSLYNFGTWAYSNPISAAIAVVGVAFIIGKCIKALRRF